ncbi:MAG: DUF2283 domain-containing protein [Bacteroidia bacterium]|nr:DUF2283 domain-containing protein [Bacteroidia bacterium]
MKPFRLMHLTYDSQVDAAYIYLRSTREKSKMTIPLESRSDGPMMFVDIGHDGKINGIEILDASTFLAAELLKPREP